MSEISERIARLSPEQRALLVQRLRKKAEEVDPDKITRHPRGAEKTSFPLSFAQQRLWFLDQLEPGGGYYNISLAWCLAGALDAAALQRSFNEIVARHEALRTSFATVDDEPVQFIHKTNALPLTVVDLRGDPAASREGEARRLVAEEAKRTFDLSRSPLIRVYLVHSSDSEHLLSITMHHIVSDGWSMGVLFRELMQLYDAYIGGRLSPLVEMPIQYADYAEWQRQRMQGEALNRDIAFWNQQLAGAPPLIDLPLDRPRPALKTYRGARASRVLPRELSGSLKALSQSEGATLFMTLLAGFKALLWRYSGSDDIVVGSPVANRDRTEIEGLIGFFVNTLVLRTDLSGDPTFRELLMRVREVSLGAYAHQQLPFEKLIEVLRPQRSASYSPLFQVMFALQNANPQRLALTGLTVEPLAMQRETAKFDLSVVCEEHDNDLKVFAIYNTDLFDAESITRLLTHFQSVLEKIAAGPGARISDLPPLTNGESPSRKRIAEAAASAPGDEGCAPLSAAQRRLWILHRLEPQSAAFNRPITVRLSGHFDLDVLGRSLDAIIERHEALRTVFFERDGQPFQRVLSFEPVAMRSRDLSGLADAREEEALRVAVELVQQPFDLSCGPMVRAMLLRLDAREHVLLLSMHHIVIDGWSEGVLLRELVLLYEAFLRGRPSPLPRLRAQYSDFAIAQRERLAGDALRRQLTYWKRQLHQLPALELSADNPRPDLPSNRAATVALILPADLVQRLEAFSRREGATLFMALLALFQALLARYSRQDDFAVGVPVAGRSTVEAEKLIGCFMNVLVLRADVSGHPNFRELLARVRGTSLDAYANQETPFEKLVETLRPERVANRWPLFQTMLQLRNLPSFDVAGESALKITPFRFESGHIGGLDLSVEIANVSGELHCAFIYARELFRQETIVRMARHFHALAQACVDAPNRPLCEQNMLSTEEEHRMLIEWNATQTAYSSERCIHYLFEDQAEKTPSAIALIFEEQQLTYGELNSRANSLARYLQKLGAGAETIVGLCVTRSIEMIVGVLGILKAGGAYLPLDPAYPEERLRFMLEDAKAPLLVTLERLVSDLPSSGAKLVCLDSDWRAIAAESDVNLSGGATAGSLAYVIYTSGSTGTPKGVMVEHRSLVNYSENAAVEYALRPEDRVLQFASLNFDASAEEIYPCLIRGATLVLRNDEMMASTTQFLRTCADWKVSVLSLPTAWWHEVAASVVAKKLAIPASLRLVIVGGEAAAAERLENWQQWAGSRVGLINTYGPTEATIVATRWKAPQALGDPAAVPIGRPIANTRIYLLDENLSPAPVGVAGELHIGGAGLARGYLNQPELTGEKFIPNPFSGDPSARLYKTGDLARYLPDGNIEFLGRIDAQVKIRGFRIELGEVEAVLRECPDVKACAVLAREDTPGNKRLVAYVVRRENAFATPGGFRDFLGGKLPGYMLPSAFVLLDKLPITANGKLDRKALAPPDQTRDDSAVTYVAPRTPAEETLASIWGGVLKVDQVGIHDNFFDLGGHSLLATQLISRVRSAFNVELPLRALFEMPTIEALSREVAKHLGGEVEGSLTTIPRRSSRGAAPLSFAQQRLWFLDQLELASAAYHMPIALRLTGALNVMALRASLSEIVRRHEALRTTFATAGNEPAQVIGQPYPIDLAVNDLSHLVPPAREDEALRLASGEAKRPFSLASGPLFRAQLFKLDDEHHLLVLVIHHIVCDGWSMSVLSRELSALYRAHVRGERSPLTELPIQYADYAVWQRSWFEEREMQRQLSYWKKQLDAAPPLSEFPGDYPRPASQRYQGARESLTISKELAGKLALLSRREGVTLFMTLLAAFKVLLCRYSGQEDLLIGTHIAGRNRRELEGMIGFFIGTLALRTGLSGNPAFREVLARVREVALGAYAHQDVPFERLVEELEPERSLSHTPLVQVVFNMLNLPDIAIDLPGLTVTRLPLGAGGPKFDLTLYAGEREEGIVFNAVYNTDLFQAATIKRALRHFETLLQGIVADPDCRLSKLPLLKEPEAVSRSNEVCPTQAFSEFSAAAIEQSIARRFEQQARHCANSLAIKTRTHEWSYEELNRAANRTAQALLKLRGGGVERVALLLDHDAPMIAAVLGVLKTGKSYVPLDPAYPRERLAYMLADSQPGVLLTDSANLALAQILSNLQPLNIDAFESVVSNVDVVVSPDAVAYTLYTSGSTGQPKGVVQNHRNVLHFIRAYTNNLHISANDRLTLFSSYTFDSSVQDIFAALLNGAALYPVNLKEEGLGDAVQWLIGNGITIYHSTPSTYRHFIRALTGEEAFSAVRLIVLGGEAAYKADVDAYRKHFPASCLFVNGFGLTESTVNLQYFVDHKTEVSRNAVPIGYPAADTEIVLLDDDGEPTQLYGEIGIRSSHVALGYWNQSALTRARFINDAVAANKRIYRTGDMGRVLPGGSLEFAGRKDNQVKLRGYRIELGEIEAVLAGHPAVRECAAVLNENGIDPIIAAYIVPCEGADFIRAELRGFLKARLPDYMIPSAFVALDHLPLTASGKTNYRELSRRDDARAGPDVAFVAPRMPSEQTLASIWAEVLKVEKIGIHDNFFDLGGHSLLATQVISRVRKTFELDIPLRALFELPTVAGLSAHIVQSQAEALTEGELTQLLAEAEDQR